MQLKSRNVSGTEQTLLKGTNGGAVELYYDGSKKFNTSANGATFTGNLHFDDGGSGVSANKISMGNGSDLQLYHDGSNSKIVDAGTGSLLLLSDSFKVQNGAGDEDMIRATQDGKVELYNNNHLRLETHSDGVSFRSTNHSTSKAHWSEGSLKPWANDTYDLGDASYNWRALHVYDGIYFGGNNTTATQLDDYEEGTWTPVLQGYTGTQWDDVTYDNALDYTQGNYVKIGSTVFIYYYSGNFDLASGWNTSFARINGLPFAFRNSAPWYGGIFTFTHTNCFKDQNNNLFDCHSGYGVYSQNYINPSIGNSPDQAKWGSESNRYMMVAGVYQTNV